MTARDDTPYARLPPAAFWRSGVAARGGDDVPGLWRPKFALDGDSAFATAGSCFAQHIGAALLAQGMRWLDLEPAPDAMSDEARRHGQYGLFSFRTGNVYTAAMLRQWLEWAFGLSDAPAELWREDGRCFDPMRPAVDRDGYVDADALLRARRRTFQAIRAAAVRADCFVFTLGLTEAWQSLSHGGVYPVCPGTVRGAFDPDEHRFRNFDYPEIHRDLHAAIAILRDANPELRVLLTVSPVPLTATASGEHVLVATVHSKSVLRAVAGALAKELPYVDYFPSYELISAFPFGGRHYAPNLRDVDAQGVAFVMRHFFRGLSDWPDAAAFAGSGSDGIAGDDPICEDAVLDYYANPRTGADDGHDAR